MKVLSIKEPYASLVNQEIKKIETRSWKTNYRGELYIHASSKMDDNYSNKNKDFLALLDTITYKTGYIICKCKLIDCIYMTEEYINMIKKNNYQEYICGEYKVGRYAWVLEEIQLLDVPIKAKGKLNIWTYDSQK